MPEVHIHLYKWQFPTNDCPFQDYCKDLHYAKIKLEKYGRTLRGDCTEK